MNIKIKGTVDISADVNTVFTYIANLENDHFWRKEINATTMSTYPQLGASATESSNLSKRAPANILNLVCTAYVENEYITYTTEEDSEFYLRSERRVILITEKKTQIIYELEFSKNIIKHALGFSLPGFIIKMAANGDMGKYLKALKGILED